MADNDAMRLGGLILAGGHSRRMGRPKQLLPIDDTTLLGWQCRTLAACTAPVVVVVRDREQELPPLPAGTDLAADAEPDQGPLAGLAAGLERLRVQHGFGDDDAAFVTGCDLPHLTSAIVRWLADRLGAARAVLPRVRGIVQPLAAIYRIALLQDVQKLLAAGERAVRSLAAIDGVAIVDPPAAAPFALDPDLRAFDNVNDEPAYLAARRMLERPEGTR